MGKVLAQANFILLAPKTKKQLVDALAVIVNAINEADKVNDGPEKRKQLRAYKSFVDNIQAKYDFRTAQDVAREACKVVGIAVDW